MTRRSCIGAVVTLLIVAGCAGNAPARLRDTSARSTTPFRLPAPDTRGNMPLDEAIGRRRSISRLLPPASAARVDRPIALGRPGHHLAEGKRTAP